MPQEKINEHTGFSRSVVVVVAFTDVVSFRKKVGGTELSRSSVHVSPPPTYFAFSTYRTEYSKRSVVELIWF